MSRARGVFGAAAAERLRSAADRLLAYPFEPWFYGDSVGFEGLMEASLLFDDPRYRDFAARFIRGWLDSGERGQDDNTAPGRVMCQLAAEGDDDRLRSGARALASELAARRRVAGCAVTFEDASRSLREPYGELALPAADRALLEQPGAGVYVDCLHFDPPFYSALAGLLGDDAWAIRAAEEAHGYVRSLQDPASGLFHHFWLERNDSAYALGWGRGQGWALLGLLDVLDDGPPDPSARIALVRAVERLLDSMLDGQRADGGWDAVVGVDASGDETSTAAFMVAGFLRAARIGVGDRRRLGSAAERAWTATIDAVDGSGLLTGVSAAVYSSTLDAHYHHVPRGFDVPWGQGPLLLAASEVVAA